MDGVILGVPGFQIPFTEISFPVDLDESLILFSDGLTEPFENKNFVHSTLNYGTYQLIEFIKKQDYLTLSAKTLHEKIIKEFCGQGKQADDVTLIVMKRKVLG